jgi:hypothetical protein
MSGSKAIRRQSLRQRRSAVYGWRLALVTAFAAILGCSGETTSEKKPAAIILEATLTEHGIGGFRHSSLFVRLAENGNVEWDELEWDPAPKRGDPKVVDVYKNVQKVATISPERVAFIERWLGSLDLQGIEEKMGPFNGYIDSSYEIQVRMAKAVANPMVFSVSNPWCGEGETCFNSKPLPSNLSLILCEISQLRAEATHEPVENSCRGEREPRS